MSNPVDANGIGERTRRAVDLSLAACLSLWIASTLIGCTNSGPSFRTGRSAAGPCPVAPINVVVSVDQWGDVVATLSGNCAK